MSKGIIVVDNIPKNCEECRFSVFVECGIEFCKVKREYIDSDKPDWCPIKPKNDEWIPAEEKMPKDGELVWVTEYGKVKRAYYAGETKLGRVFVQTDGWHKIIEEKNVSGWQPDYIPEPYIGKGED